MAAWALPLAMGLGSAAAGYMGSKGQREPREQSYNNRTMIEKPDFVNWAFTPEQNQQYNMSDVLLGDLLSMVMNLGRSDKDLAKLLGGGLGGPAMNRSYRGNDKQRDVRNA